MLFLLKKFNLPDKIGGFLLTWKGNTVTGHLANTKDINSQSSFNAWADAQGRLRVKGTAQERHLKFKK